MARGAGVVEDELDSLTTDIYRKSIDDSADTSLESSQVEFESEDIETHTSRSEPLAKSGPYPRLIQILPIDNLRCKPLLHHPCIRATSNFKSRPNSTSL